MDGYAVNIADTVYDVAYGEGVVVQLLGSSNKFIVTFEGINRSISYDMNGIGPRPNKRTLYWHDPVLVVPAKPEPLWAKTRVVCMNVAEVLRVNNA
jgi:hypothetical protein